MVQVRKHNIQPESRATFPLQCGQTKGRLKTKKNEQI